MPEKHDPSGCLVILCLGMFIVSLWSVIFGVSVGWSVFHSQSPVQVQAIVVGHKQEQGQSKYKVEDVENKAPGNSVAARTKPDGEIGDGNNASGHKQSEKHTSSGIDPNWVIAALTLVAVCVYIRQTTIMKKALEETKTSSAIAQKSLELSERAELQITDVSLPPWSRPASDGSIQITYRNFGRTVATEIIVNVRFESMVNATLAATPIILAPNTESHFVASIHDINGILSTDTIGRFCSGDDPFVIVVEIAFTDIFNKRTATVYNINWDHDSRGIKFSSVKRKQE